MQFTQISPSVTAQNPSVFKFGQNEIRVFQKDHEPWFLAADVCKALELTNPTASLKVLAPNEKTKIDIGRPEKANVISESGLYVLILRCQDAIKEGSIAYQFRIWVTKEVLPAIRKTGQYSAAEKSSEVVPLTPRQQYKIQRAVAERAKGSHVHFNTIYKAIKIYFKVAKYDQIPASRFDECINFIQTVDLRIPEVLSDQPFEFPKPQLPYCPHCVLRPVPKGGVILDQYGAEKLLGFVYEFKYLHRKQLEAFHALLVSVRSPLAGAFYETMNSWAVSNVESLLERNGYSVKDLDCYRHFIGVTA